MAANDMQGSRPQISQQETKPVVGSVPDIPGVLF